MSAPGGAVSATSCRIGPSSCKVAGAAATPGTCSLDSAVVAAARFLLGGGRHRRVLGGPLPGGGGVDELGPHGLDGSLLGAPPGPLWRVPDAGLQVGADDVQGMVELGLRRGRVVHVQQA